MSHESHPPGERASRKARLPVALLLLCVLLVSFWQIMSWNARRGFDAFKITHKTLQDFEPRIKGFELNEVLVREDPLQPNIISFNVKPKPDRAGGRSAPNRLVLIRLAHGYNVVDCMRIKHYTVEPLPSHDASFPHQVWRITSAIGDQSIWMTSMHDSEHFAPLEMDTRDMPFPKIGTPDDPGWQPSGLKLTSLHRPIYNFKRMMRSRWNNARCDLLTFLKLRRPVYASDEILTLVSAIVLPPANNNSPAAIEKAQITLQQQVHAGMVEALMAYRRQKPASVNR